jgi:hypothetical protein
MRAVVWWDLDELRLTAERVFPEDLHSKLIEFRNRSPGLFD